MRACVRACVCVCVFCFLFRLLFFLGFFFFWGGGGVGGFLGGGVGSCSFIAKERTNIAVYLGAVITIVPMEKKKEEEPNRTLPTF